MEYEINDKEITFTVKTDQPGKWAIVVAVDQVSKFWHEVRHHAVFKREAFEKVIIKIERVDFLESVDNGELRSEKP